jgi:hypothetical protein
MAISVSKARLKKIHRELAARGASPLSGALSLATRFAPKRALWKLFLAYFNGKEPAVEEDFGPFYRSLVGLEQIAYVLIVEVLGDMPGPDTDTWELSDRQLRKIRESAQELHRHRAKFVEAVRWFCLPKNPKLGVAVSEHRRLLSSGKLEWGRYPNIDMENEKFVRYFEQHGLKDFTLRASLCGVVMVRPRLKHLVDFFCAFLLCECANKGYAMMPIKFCVRPGCGRLILPARRTKDYCDDCYSRAYWTPEKRFEHRIKNFPETMKRRLRREHEERLARKKMRAKKRAKKNRKKMRIHQ